MLLKANVVLAALASSAIAGATIPAKIILQNAKTYTVPLTSQARVNIVPSLGATGDVDGSGLVQLPVDPDHNQLCYDFRLSGLSTPLMAHIHRVSASQFTGPGGNLHDCVLWTPNRLAEIVSDPSNFYVNLATTEFPDGAVRGQNVGLSARVRTGASELARIAASQPAIGP